MPGIRRRLYYIEKVNIVAFPTLGKASDSNQTMGGMAKLTGNFTLADSKFFKFIDLKDEASNATFDPVGENGSKLFNNQVHAIVSGQADDVKGLARQSVNEDLVFVYQNRDGGFCVLGNEMFETHTSPSGDTGAEATGAITTTFDIQVYDECPVPSYEGELKLSATEYVDCSDGKVKTYPVEQNPQ